MCYLLSTIYHQYCQHRQYHSNLMYNLLSSTIPPPQKSEDRINSKGFRHLQLTSCLVRFGGEAASWPKTHRNRRKISTVIKSVTRREILYLQDLPWLRWNFDDFWNLVIFFNLVFCCWNFDFFIYIRMNHINIFS